MSPTVFKDDSFRFFFFSREETRLHVHVTSPDGEAKFWLDPVVALADYSGYTKVTLTKIQNIIEDRKDEIVKKWKTYF